MEGGRLDGGRVSRRAALQLRAAFGRRLLQLRGRRGCSRSSSVAKAGLSGGFLGEVDAASTAQNHRGSRAVATRRSPDASTASAM